MTVSISGATLQSGQGIDVPNTVSQLTYAAQAPERIWQQQSQALKSQNSALTQLNQEISSLATAVDALKDPAGALLSQVVNSSQPSVVSGSATPGTPSGEHQIVVTNLATTSSAYSGIVATGDTVITDDSFTFQVGDGTVNTITIDSSHNTLNSLAKFINQQGYGVTASVITDSTGSRLALVSETSGDDGNLTVAGGTNFSMQQGAPGRNAHLTVDGVPVSSASNTLTGIVPGLTLNLSGSTSGVPVTLSVAPDSSKAIQAIKDFVDAYNTVIKDLNAQFAVNPSTHTSGTLGADSTARMVQSQILGLASQVVPGGSMRTLRDLGINMENDGTLTVNDTVLSDQIQKHFADVTSFLQGAGDGTDGLAYGLAKQLDGLTDSVSGAFYVDIQGNNSSISSLSRQIDDFEVYIASKQQIWTAQYNRINVMLQQLPGIQQQLQTELGLK